MADPWPPEFEDAAEWVRRIPTGTAERCYAGEYIVHRMVGAERPAAVEFGVAVRTAELIRREVDDRLPKPPAEPR